MLYQFYLHFCQKNIKYIHSSRPITTLNSSPELGQYVLICSNIYILRVLTYFFQGHLSLLTHLSRKKTLLPIWHTSSLTSTPVWVSSSKPAGCWPQLTATYREY